MPEIQGGSGGGVSAASVGVQHLESSARGAFGWAPTNAISESIFGRAFNTNQSFLSSGRLGLVALKTLPGGVTVNTITFVSATTAAGTPTNQWFCLVDQSLNVLAKTNDDTTTAWAGNSAKTLTISGGYTPADDIAVYAGIVVAATTVPTLAVQQLASGSNIATLAPKLSGNSTTGLTNPASLGATAAAISGNENIIPYAYVS